MKPYFPTLTLEYCALVAMLALVVHALAGAVGAQTLQILARVTEVMR